MLCISKNHSAVNAWKVFRQKMCVFFLFLDDEFSATALLSEESRIKNTYTDGTKFRKGKQIHNICRKPPHIFYGM